MNFIRSVRRSKFMIRWPRLRMLTHEYGIKLTDIDRLEPVEAVIVAVPHETYLKSGWPLIVSLLKNARGVVMDVKSRLDRTQTPPGVELWRL